MAVNMAAVEWDACLNFALIIDILLRVLCLREKKAVEQKMSRHRNVRGYNYDEGIYGEYDISPLLYKEACMTAS